MTDTTSTRPQMGDEAHQPSWLLSALVSKINNDQRTIYGHRAALVRAKDHRAAEKYAFDQFAVDGYFLESVDVTELTDDGVPGFVRASLPQPPAGSTGEEG